MAEKAPECDVGHKNRSAEGNQSRRKPGIVAIGQTESSSGSWYVIDRKGDPQNVLYGGNYSTSRYRRSGFGSIIGLDKQYRIRQDGSQTSPLDNRDSTRKRHTQSLLTSKNNSKLELEQIRPIINKDGSEDIETQRSYIAIGPDKVKRRKRDSMEKVEKNVLPTAVRDSKIAGISGGEDVPSSSESESESAISFEEKPDAYESFRNDVRRQHLIELNRATTESPEDVKAWLALINAQDHISGIDEQTPLENYSIAVRRNLAEIKVALYEKALTRVTDRVSSEILVTGLMRQGAFIWDTSTLTKKWLTFLKKDSSIDLWISYLNFQQAKSVNFDFQECLELHENCLKRASTEPDLTFRDECSIYILLRTVVFMSQSGFTERAIALWQVMLEFTFFRPNLVDSSSEISSFEAFWESEVPRIGEAGARGWSTGGTTESAPQKPNHVGNSLRTADLFEDWAQRETKMVSDSPLPARVLDDVSENDPFRIILYSDLREYVFRPNTSAGHLLLINAFLKFCELPAIYRAGLPMYSKWWSDEFLSSDAHDEQSIDAEGAAVLNANSLFPCHGLPSPFPHATISNAKNSWQRMALKHLAAILLADDALAEYVVAYEATFDPKEARKFAKSLLKTRPTNLRLYNTYALLECRLGRCESAEHVWGTSISLCQSSANVKRVDLANTWCSWIWECLHQGNMDKAEGILACIPDSCIQPDQISKELPLHPAAKIRVKNFFESHQSQSLSLRQDDSVFHYTELLAIFVYLANSQSLSSTLQVYGNAIERLKGTTAGSNIALTESLHQSRAHLLHLHPTLSPQGYRPAEITKPLAESRRLFPNNLLFHHLYQQHIQRTGFVERLRDTVPLQLSNPKRPNVALPYRDSVSSPSIPHHLFTIQTELSRPSYGGSTSHSIRAAFEHAVSSAPSSLAIWSRYVLWEASLDQKASSASSSTPNAAVAAFYRAIRACPWAKELHMLAFRDAGLRKAIGPVDLRRIYEGMLEKGLRIRVELDVD